MKLKGLVYSESREYVNTIGLKQWNKIAIEVEPENGESWDNVYLSAKEQVKQWHQDSENVSGVAANTIIASAEVKEINIAHEKIEVIIENAASIEELATVKQGLPAQLMPAYMKKLKELTNGK